MQHVDGVSDVEPLSLPSWSCGPWIHDDPGLIVVRLDGSDRVGRSLGRTRHIRYHATVRAAEAKLTIRLSPAAGMLSGATEQGRLQSSVVSVPPCDSGLRDLRELCG